MIGRQSYEDKDKENERHAALDAETGRKPKGKCDRRFPKSLKDVHSGIDSFTFVSPDIPHHPELTVWNRCETPG